MSHNLSSVAFISSLPTSLPSSPSQPVLTPSTSTSGTPPYSQAHSPARQTQAKLDMDDKQVQPHTGEVDATPASSESSKVEAMKQDTLASTKASKTEQKHVKKHKHKKRSKGGKKSQKHVSSSDSSSSEEDETEDDSDDSSSSSSSEEKSRHDRKQKARKKKMMRRLKKKTKRNRRPATDTDDSSSSSSESTDEEDEEDRRSKRRGVNKSRRLTRNTRIVEDYDPTEEEEYGQIDTQDQIAGLQAQLDTMKLNMLRTNNSARIGRQAQRGIGRRQHRLRSPDRSEHSSRSCSSAPRNGRSKGKNHRKGSKPQYKRVDEIWDTTIHNYRLVDTAEAQVDEFEHYIFTVRRTFDWENRPKSVIIALNSKLLKECLQEVLTDVKGLVLDQDKPEFDPNVLFLYLEELRAYANQTLKSKLKSTKKRKEQKKLKLMRSHCKVLIGYIDEDYKDIKKSLKGLLKAGEITFDLLWAIFKPNSIAFTTTYGNAEDPRCFKVDYTSKCSSFMRGDWYCIEGRYLEYDGKSFGLGDFDADVDAYKGPRKITSLSCYPLQYHKDVMGITKQLVERGKKFVAMDGMSYKAMKGMSYTKRKKGVAKINVNGRIMIDPATFRRINPNYPISSIKAADPDGDLSDSEVSECPSCCGSGSEVEEKKNEYKTKKIWKFIRDKKNKDQLHAFQVEVDESGQSPHIENLETLPVTKDKEKAELEFTEEALLIASPVVLGFAFSEKAWLEFSVSSVREIEWNEGAFESLVLPPGQKSIIKALVESHKYEAARTIDDVVQGKGKGLVAVLHGPPGTGKTLTAEGIAELLKCPLYMVSVGELGTEPARLEESLNRILDMAHTWGALILLDEADVFLERRQTTDIHRNALVSVFLRLLEYFQGILFLTTNRVETFDEAFQSRIHLALKYGDLTVKARRAVWKMFLERIRSAEEAEDRAAEEKKAIGVKEGGTASTAAAPDTEVEPLKMTTINKKTTGDQPSFTEHDYDILARKVLNGRQIKNIARTAQALALNEGTKVSTEHVKKVLEVQEAFEQDLKGGSGYNDAMRSYT